MRLMITQSLLGAWQWYCRAPEDKEVEERAKFESTLRKEWVDNEAMRAGREFEDRVHAAAYTGKPYIDEKASDYAACVNEIADACRGGRWQVPVSRDLVIDGQTYFLYGKTDVVIGPKIIDVKFTGSYEFPKFLESPQHPMYFYCAPWCQEFEYQVSNGRDTFVEKYLPSEIKPIETTIREFLSFLSANPWANELFLRYWPARG